MARGDLYFVKRPLFYPSGPVSPAPLRAAVGFDDVFDLSAAYGAAGVGHFLELDTTRVAQTHVSAGVDDRVHHVLVADGALIRPGHPARRAGGRLGEADGRVGRRSPY